mmetsp:Transcript_49963/g.139982  ORF Transcript_49963/g.139982 Transcript_49963/m.139982 type:complete len:639 (-) Transcript_49963:3-1919(-)
MAAVVRNGATDAELERQAQAMAESAMGSWGSAPSEKLLAVKQQILQRLLKQRDANAEAVSSPAMPPRQSHHANSSFVGAVPPPPPPPPTGNLGFATVTGSVNSGLNGKYFQQPDPYNERPHYRHAEDPFVMFYSAKAQKWYISTDLEDTGFVFIESDAALPPEGVWSKGTTINLSSVGAAPAPAAETLKVDGVELCGDEPWFADSAARQRLRESVAEGHREQKIIVGPSVAEVSRICPTDGRIVGAGAVLRLGGAHIGGYGEPDIAYAYRQLSRALHPDKNPDVPGAAAAFQRLTVAADELRAALNEQRLVLHTIVAAMDGNATSDMLERPQEALFAESCRLLTAVCGLAGEGWVPEQAQKRIAQAFVQSGIFHRCIPDALLAAWFGGSQLLELFSGPSVRTAYDCAPKRMRAQFLCLLNRVLLAEAKRSDGCVRATWSGILEAFPELGMWRAFRERLQLRVWEPDPNSGLKKSKWDDKGDEKERSRSRSRSRSGRERSPDPRKAIATNPETGEPAGRWALKWRTAMAVILPSGCDGAVNPSDPDVRKLAQAMWKDVVSWAGDSEPGLRLFMADHQNLQRGLAPTAPPAQWCFIPMSDLLLTVGSGLVGFTAEGVFAANRRGHERKSLAKCYKPKAAD